MEVLVVDDEVFARNMLRTILTKSGYEVLTASNGQEALDILRASACRMVVSDWEMPEFNGIELCRAVRSGAVDGYVYFIVLTSHDRPQDVVEGLEAGADDFVKKPYDPAEIVVRVRAGERLMTLEVSEMTVFAMAKLAESRDPETGAHLERVRSYCRVITEHLRAIDKYRSQIDEEYVRLIFQASPLHDIGKVAIPDCVLLKAGRLTDEEFGIMKTHTVSGATTLEAAMAKYPNARFLQMARDIALTHHEKVDGTGYPNGLSGDDTPLCGRIVALADVYDALSTKRVYKEAFTHSVTRSIIIEDRDKHFDPDVVDAFVANEQQFIDIRQEYSEGIQAAA